MSLRKDRRKGSKSSPSRASSAVSSSSTGSPKDLSTKDLLCLLLAKVSRIENHLFSASTERVRSQPARSLNDKIRAKIELMRNHVDTHGQMKDFYLPLNDDQGRGKACLQVIFEELKKLKYGVSDSELMEALKQVHRGARRINRTPTQKKQVNSLRAAMAYRRKQYLRHCRTDMEIVKNLMEEEEKKLKGDEKKELWASNELQLTRMDQVNYICSMLSAFDLCEL